MSKVLVTGGLGTVGKVLVLCATGHDDGIWARALARRTMPAISRAICSLYACSKGDPRYVYNLAAEFGRWNGEDHDRMWTSNVIGTKNLLRLQEKHGFS
jgi:dTDP-glucose 4,6-dehydratase